MIRSSALRLAYHCPIATEIDLSRPCEVCNEKVHDLSAMTEREVRALLRKHRGDTICVLYRFDVNQIVELSPKPQTQSRLPALAMAMSALACAPAMAEQHTDDPSENVARAGTEIEVTSARRDRELAERTRSFPAPSHSEVDRGAGWHDGDEVGLLIENPDTFELAVARARAGRVEPRVETSEPACPVNVGSREMAAKNTASASSDELTRESQSEPFLTLAPMETGFFLGGAVVEDDRFQRKNGVTTQPTDELIRALRKKARARRERRAQRRKRKGGNR